MSRLAGLGVWPVAVVVGIVVAGAVTVETFFPQLIGKPDTETAATEAAMRPADPAEKSGSDPAKQEAANQDAAKRETAKQEAAKQEAAKREAAKQEAAKTPTPTPETTAPPPAATAQLPPPPSFDVVRVEADGSALVAGKGAPDWQVVVELDGAEVMRETAGSDGKFATFLSLPVADEPQVLTLAMYGPAGEGPVSSTDRVILSPRKSRAVAAADTTAPDAPQGDAAGGATPALPGSDPVMATKNPDRPEDADNSAAADTASAPRPGAADAPEKPEGATATANAPDAPTDSTPPKVAETGARPEAPGADTGDTAPEERAAPTVILAGKDETRVLQTSDVPPDVMDEVAIDTISYTEAGEVELSGRGKPEGFVRVYLDNRHVIESRIAEDGTWRTDLPDVDKGVYALRVDELDEDGNVRSRAETPFEREDEEAVRSALRAQMKNGVLQLTVQPGFTLWAIARENLGDGVRYVQVYEANRDRIRDPDLIYPGQIFKVPGSDGAAPTE